MSKFIVVLERVEVTSVEVEADSREEAIRRAQASLKDYGPLAVDTDHTGWQVDDCMTGLAG